MEHLQAESKPYSAVEKFWYVLAGALITGAMWRARGSHGWGSEWGVFTVGLVLMTYVLAVFRRRTNATYFLVISACACCMATVPAWGTLLNQTSGYFESHATAETAACSPLSGVFIMLCLGFGAMPLYMFLLSRLFSGEKFTLRHYVIAAAVFFGAFYLTSAAVSPFIIKLVQPEAVAAFENGLKAAGQDGSAYSVFMKHFTDINWAKKLPFGRNYFTEIAVVSHAAASVVLIAAQRFLFRDKAGAKVTLAGCSAFAVGITAANVFFVLKNRADLQAHPWLGSAWSFWEYFTGFIAGAILISALFAIDKKYPDAGFRDELLPKLPEKAESILLWAFVFVFGFGMSTLRPIAVRLDASDVLPAVVYAVGGVLVLILSVLMFRGKLPRVWTADPLVNPAAVLLALFAAHMVIYMFVGFTDECQPNIIVNDAIQSFMKLAVPAAFAVYIPLKRKELFK